MKETGLRQGQTPLDIIRMSCHGYSFMRCDVYWRNVVQVHLEPHGYRMLPATTARML
jgi:hypothetical protein